ncbi:MAG: aldo/keto reductase [Clostridiaceae bacterium]|nr:aldo/keto reductase [Clostridiaceae bacterium]
MRALRGGADIPAIGLGTFGSDRYDAAAVAQAVRLGISLGYRFIDCAAVYGNEAAIGPVLEEAFTAGISRSQFFIVSKVWNDHHGRGDVLLSCARTLRDLRLDYLDLYLVHWPFRNFHPQGAAPDYHDASARPYLHERYMETWYQMERLQRAGYVRQIGTSNMTVPKLARLLQDCTIMPAANEMELHPAFQQPELFDYCQAHGIQPIGFCPLGSPSRPDRDRSADDAADMEDADIKRIAGDHGVHPALICLKWAVQRGQIPIPFAVKPEQLRANLQAVSEDPLTGREMAELAAADRNCRLIKGQVFLWDGAKDWTDLWDPDGRISGDEKK